MKISKLFHWLYGLVMLLPIFAIGVTCGYAIFNKNAYQSYYGKTINDSTITYVNVIDENEKYYFIANTDNNNNRTLSYIYGQIEDIYFTNSNSSTIAIQNDIENINRFFLHYNINLNTYSYGFINVSNEYKYISQSLLNYLVFTTDREQTNIDYVNTIYYKTYNKDSFISEVFYYSIDRVQQSPLFNWAYNSFLVAPFSYIVSLFSMPTNSFVVMLLSYWLAISIIWLVFDLVMYVPLLVHRWLDKGVLE